MEAQLRTALFPAGLGVATTPVEDGYSADSVDELKPSGGEEALAAVNLAAAIVKWKQNHLDRFLASITRGTNAVLAYVHAEVFRCPSTAIVLAGYSQGAMAVHEAEVKMSRGDRAHVSGTILLADGDRVPNTAAGLQLGSSRANGEGVRTYLHMNARRDVPLPGSTVDICNTHDLVCDFTAGSILHYSRDSTVHTTYGKHALPQKAANWLAHRIIQSHAGVTLRAFAGQWTGHGRQLVVGLDGIANISIDDGCCTQVLRMRVQLSAPAGTPAHATALARVVSIKLANPTYYTGQYVAPHVGQTGRISLNNGVITDPLDGFNTTFCGYASQMHGVCGA